MKQSLENILSKTTPKNKSCLIWTGITNKITGYGYTTLFGKLTSVHRATWVLFHNKTIPDGYVIHHICSVKLCINPKHLECITHNENLTKPDALMKNCFNIHKLKTHCPKGHDYTKVMYNVNGYPHTQRICKICKRLSYLKRKQKLDGVLSLDDSMKNNPVAA